MSSPSSEAISFALSSTEADEKRNEKQIDAFSASVFFFSFDVEKMRKKNSFFLRA